MTVPRIAVIMVLGAWAGCLDTSDGGVKSVSAPASQLSIEPTIVDDNPAPADGMIAVTVKVFQANEFVRLSTANLTVDGVTVPYSTSGYAARIPIVPAGGNIKFAHVQSGVTTEFTYEVPPRPTIISPMPGEGVPRTTNMMITYVSAKAQAVRPSATDGSFGTTGIEQTDNGMAFLDVSGLRPSTGSLTLARRYVATPSMTGFQSATVTYTISSPPIPVGWQ
jgi:hypothetical protein